MKERIYDPQGPKPVGPYSPAIRANGLIFVSGQIPLDPETGELCRGDIQEQTRQVLENLKKVLEAAGSDLDRVVKTTVFLSNLGDFDGMNQVYGRYFGPVPPARSTIQAAALPKGVGIEIEAIALE